MLKQRIVNTNKTEIYIDGGGEAYITEAKATVFHNFWTSKVLAPGESIDDFKEVTAKERQNLEKIAEEWVEPSEEFIAIWEFACIATNGITYSTVVQGGYNRDTHYFFLNGLDDITTSQAQSILIFCLQDKPFATSSTNKYVRTLLPMKYNTAWPDLITNNYIESLWGVGRKHGNTGYYPSVFNYGQNCLKIKDFRYFRIEGFASSLTFQGWSALEDISDIQITAKGTLVIKWSSKLKLESVRCLVEANPEGNIIQVHANIYAALTGTAESYPFNGGTQEEWEQLLEDATEKNITFTTA